MLELLLNNRGAIQHGLVFGTTIFAWWRGAAPEKLAGSILTASILLFYAYRLIAPAYPQYEAVIPAYLALDLIVFAALVPLAMRANRVYPLWLLAAQLIVLGMHFQRLLPTIEPLGYFVLVHGPSWIQAIAFCVGMILHRRRVRTFGAYRSWRKRSHP